MPEGETLPKSNKSKEWLDYADKKLEEIRDLGAKPETRYLGIGPKRGPLSQMDATRMNLLSQNELSARSKGMKLKREEDARGKAGMKKGGKVRATGKRTLHKGEMVSRKSCRSGSRGCKR